MASLMGFLTSFFSELDLLVVVEEVFEDESEDGGVGKKVLGTT